MLIKNGYLAGLGVRDIQIKDGAIAAIGSTTDDQEVIDATGMVVIPGFVDTHRHLVQAPLRGIGADMTLAHYLSDMLGRMRFTAEEAHRSILLGAVEALDAGVTTILDWSTATVPTEVSLDALKESGIRAVFGNNNNNEQDIRRHVSHDGLVTTALAPLGPDYLPDTLAHIRLARELGVITSIHVGGQKPGGVAALRDHLGPDLHFVHGNRSTDDEIRMIVDSGASLTVTTIVESVMGHGKPAYGRFAEAGGRPALGVDVVINNRPDMFSEMQATLWHERVNDRKITAADLLTAATVNGAKAMHLETGELKEGKRADLVLLDGLDHLIGTQELEGAIVATAGTENVRTVLVDGKVVKRDGVLVNHDLRALREATKDLARRVVQIQGSSAASAPRR